MTWLQRKCNGLNVFVAQTVGILTLTLGKGQNHDAEFHNNFKSVLFLIEEFWYIFRTVVDLNGSLTMVLNQNFADLDKLGYSKRHWNHSGSNLGPRCSQMSPIICNQQAMCANLLCSLGKNANDFVDFFGFWCYAKIRNDDFLITGSCSIGWF